MKTDERKLQLRKIGKGFITCNSEGLIGRMLTQAFIDQNKKVYIKLDGKFIPLTAQHAFMAAD